MRKSQCLLLVPMLLISLLVVAAPQPAPPIGIVEPTVQHIVISEQSRRNPLPGVSVANTQGDTIRLGYVNLGKGSSTPAHNHAGEQIMIPQSGKLECTVGGEIYTVVPGEVLVIPAWVAHTCKGLEATSILEVHQQTAPTQR